MPRRPDRAARCTLYWGIWKPRLSHPSHLQLRLYVATGGPEHFRNQETSLYTKVMKHWQPELSVSLKLKYLASDSVTVVFQYSFHKLEKPFAGFQPSQCRYQAPSSSLSLCIQQHDHLRARMLCERNKHFRDHGIYPKDRLVDSIEPIDGICPGTKKAKL